MSKTVLVLINYSNKLNLDVIIGNGKILWQGSNGFEWIGSSNEDWDEIYIIKYSDSDFQLAIERFKESSFTQLELLKVKPSSYIKLKLVQLMMRFVFSWLPFKLVVDESVVVENLLEKNDSPVLPSSKQFSRLFEDGQTENPVAMLNLLKYRKIPEYPSVFSGVPEKTGAAAYNKYSMSVLRVVSKLGGYILHLGNVEGSLLGNEGKLWDEYAIMRYPDRKALRKMFSFKDQGNKHLKIHRDAGLDKTLVIALRPK